MNWGGQHQQAGARPSSDRHFGKEISNLHRRERNSFTNKLNSQSLTLKESADCPGRRPQALGLPNEPQFASPHSVQILSYLWRAEQERPHDLFSGQTDINDSMRSVLVDWLVEVHCKLRLMPETLHLVVQLVDQYLAAREVRKAKLQLLGVGCLLIAAKFEETYRVPSLKDLIYLAANCYTKQDILEMETSVLEVVGFQMQKTTMLSFLPYYTHVSRFDDKDYFLAQYICELSLLESRFNAFRTSLVVLAAVYLINKIRSRAPQFNESLLRGTGAEEAGVRKVAKELCELLKCAQSKGFTKSLRKKFSGEEFKEVSRVRIQKKN